MTGARIPCLLIALMLLSACASSVEGGGKGEAHALSTHFAGMMTLDDPHAFRAEAAERGFVVTDDGIVLDVQTQGLREEHRARVAGLEGVRLLAFQVAYERIDAVAADPRAVRAIGSLPFVRAVTPSFGATMRDGGKRD